MLAKALETFTSAVERAAGGSRAWSLACRQDLALVMALEPDARLLAGSASLLLPFYVPPPPASGRPWDPEVFFEALDFQIGVAHCVATCAGVCRVSPISIFQTLAPEPDQGWTCPHGHSTYLLLAFRWLPSVLLAADANSAVHSLFSRCLLLLSLSRRPAIAGACPCALGRCHSWPRPLRRRRGSRGRAARAALQGAASAGGWVVGLGVHPPLFRL